MAELSRSYSDIEQCLQHIDREEQFKNEVIDKEVYEALMERRGLIDKRYEEVGFLLFSLSGFSKWVKENAHPDMVRLDLYK